MNSSQQFEKYSKIFIASKNPLDDLKLRKIITSMGLFFFNNLNMITKLECSITLSVLRNKIRCNLNIQIKIPHDDRSENSTTFSYL